MRRKELEITDRARMESIIHRCRVCRVGMCDGDRPYVVPVCFGLKDGVLYFHSAPEGKKIDLLRRNPLVSIEFDILYDVRSSDRPCSFGVEYESVIVSGTAAFVEDPGEIRAALDAIMAQYGGPEGPYPGAMLARTQVIKVEIEAMTGKTTR